MKTKIIRLPQEKILALMAEYGATRPTVYAALRYASNSKRAEQIRQRALEMGGIKETKTLFI